MPQDSHDDPASEDLNELQLDGQRIEELNTAYVRR